MSRLPTELDWLTFGPLGSVELVVDVSLEPCSSFPTRRRWQWLDERRIAVAPSLYAEVYNATSV